MARSSHTAWALEMHVRERDSDSRSTSTDGVMMALYMQDWHLGSVTLELRPDGLGQDPHYGGRQSQSPILATIVWEQLSALFVSPCLTSPCHLVPGSRHRR